MAKIIKKFYIAFYRRQKTTLSHAESGFVDFAQCNLLSSHPQNPRYTVAAAEDKAAGTAAAAEEPDTVAEAAGTAAAVEEPGTVAEAAGTAAAVAEPGTVAADTAADKLVPEQAADLAEHRCD